MKKHSLRDAALPPELSPHSFRIAVVTDLLAQGVLLEEVQHLAGHADPRTTIGASTTVGTKNHSQHLREHLDLKEKPQVGQWRPTPAPPRKRIPSPGRS